MYAWCLWKPEMGDLTLELQTLASPYVGAENETQVLWKRIQSSLLFFFFLKVRPPLLTLFNLFFDNSAHRCHAF